MWLTADTAQSARALPHSQLPSRARDSERHSRGAQPARGVEHWVWPGCAELGFWQLSSTRQDDLDYIPGRLGSEDAFLGRLCAHDSHHPPSYRLEWR